MKHIADLPASGAAAVWRRVMRGAKVIAITGSCGKTTSSHCLGEMLSAHVPTNWRMGGPNSRRGLARVMLGTRPRHRFSILEIGTKLPGALRRAAWTYDPDVVIILQVRPVHTNNFRGVDDIAAEKAGLLDRLRGSKIAILNDDDPRVRAMKTRLGCRVLTFGRSPESDLWASEISARWPSRLAFRAHWKGDSCEVRTTLVGEHWLPSVLGALLGALAVGVPFAGAVSALKNVQHPIGRMQPVELPGGVTFLRDEFNMSLTSMEPALAVLRDADAKRRIAIVGDVFDAPSNQRRRASEVGRQVAAAADLAIFVGKHLRAAVPAAERAGMTPGTAVSLKDVSKATDYLRNTLMEGDLVLLRGACDRHFERIYFSLAGPIACSRSRCRIVAPCDTCELLRAPERTSEIR